MKNTNESPTKTESPTDAQPAVDRKHLVGQIRTAIRAGLLARVVRPLATCGDYNV